LLSKDDFKNSLALFASGVTVVTYKTQEGMGGVTVSSFSSLSLEPPLVSFCLHKNISSHNAIQDAKHFAVHILKEEQESISNSFASSKINKNHFLEEIGYILINDAPVLKDFLALLICEKETIYNGGDHSIIVGKVLQAKSNSGNPLLYFNRGYRKLLI
jgi:flavin reductase (DIM6/NTAB) family NADH-FMN oxidoreductase RutF